MVGPDGTEKQLYWVCVLVTLPNGTKVPRYREVTKAQLDKLRRKNSEFYGISKQSFNDVERTE